VVELSYRLRVVFFEGRECLGDGARPSSLIILDSRYATPSHAWKTAKYLAHPPAYGRLQWVQLLNCFLSEPIVTLQSSLFTTHRQPIPQKNFSAIARVSLYQGGSLPNRRCDFVDSSCDTLA